jgi:hypothetical protein
MFKNMTSTVITWLVACMGFRSFQICPCGPYMDCAVEQTTKNILERTD